MIPFLYLVKGRIKCAPPAQINYFNVLVHSQSYCFVQVPWCSRHFLKPV